MSMADADQPEDWRSTCKDVSEMLAKARKKALFVDVRFLVGRGESARYFSAHKMILACGSPVFEAMFFGQLAEKKDPISIPDDDPEAFEVMLRYLYREDICFPSIPIACKTYSIGDKYLIAPLQKASTDYISLTSMDDASFWGIVEGNLLSSCKCVEDRFRDYIQLNASRLLKSDESLEVPEDIVKMVTQMDEMSITESELLTFVTKWGLKKLKKDGTWKLQTLLQHIRFPTLTSQEFCRFHESFPDALDALTCLRILKHLSDPDSYTLPDWCSTNKAKRNLQAMPAFYLLGPDANLTPKPISPETPAAAMLDFSFGLKTENQAEPVFRFQLSDNITCNRAPRKCWKRLPSGLEKTN